MDYFNTAGGGTSQGGDPYAVIPQQFGNGGLPPPQNPQQFADYDNTAPDYETYQQQQAAAAAAAQQQQYRAQQAQQQSPTIYYSQQMTAAPGSYFPIHSASEHDFLGPQHPPTGTSSGGATGTGGGGAPYQAAGANKDFIIQHQQRRGNQSGQQHQQQQSQQQQQAQSQNHQGRHQQQNQNQMMGGTSNSAAHWHQMQAVQQQQVQMHRLQGAPINPQQFMVPPPTILQTTQIQGQQQQQQVPQIHQMQMQHPQMVQQGGYHPQGQQTHHQAQGHHQGGHQQHHHQNQHAQHAQHPMMPRQILKDWPIRIVVEGKYQPVILGTNASTIREIGQSTHCRVEFVNLSKRERLIIGHNERILTVHGHAEQASKAVAKILEVIQSEALKDDRNVGADIQLRLRAHNALCGRLIGKLGSSIKDIMSKTGTTISVAKYVEPPVAGGYNQNNFDEQLCAAERTIEIRGPSIEAVVQAESLISSKLKKCYEADIQVRRFQAQNAPGLLPPHPMMAPPGGPSNVIHPASLIPTPQGVIQVQHFPPSHHPATPGNSFLQPGILQITPGVTTLRQIRMWVPDSMIGALIGTKGKNIKMIIRESGANIKIEAPEEKTQRETEEAERKKQKEEVVEDTEGAGDHQEFLEDSGTVTSADAIEEKPKPVSERLVTVNGDDLELLKAQSFVFTKIAETNTSLPQTLGELDRLFMMRIRTEVSVPTRIIGRIIGKGGQNVRELQRITGAVVKIPEEERNQDFVHPNGVEEEMTMIRTFGNMHSTHNVQFRLSNLISDYYRSGVHQQKNAEHQQHGARAQQAAEHDSESASPLNQMGQLGQVPPISTSSNRTSPQSASSSKAKTP